MVARRDVTFNNTGLTNRLITGTRATNGTFNLTDAATIAVNAAEGNVFLVTLGGNRTMAAPTNPFMGQRITFLVGQDGTGGRTLAWNAAYRTNWSDTGNTLNKRCSISFVFDGGSDWMQDGSQSAYI